MKPEVSVELETSPFFESSAPMIRDHFAQSGYPDPSSHTMRLVIEADPLTIFENLSSIGACLEAEHLRIRRSEDPNPDNFANLAQALLFLDVLTGAYRRYADKHLPNAAVETFAEELADMIYEFRP